MNDPYPIEAENLGHPKFELHREWRDPHLILSEPGAGGPQEWLDLEAGIAWLDDPDRYAYLRESVVSVMSPGRRPRCPHPEGRLVAYSIIRPGGPRQLHRRRVWWVSPVDRAVDPGGPYRVGWPVEAVDPASVRPRRVSRFPRRERWDR